MSRCHPLAALLILSAVLLQSACKPAAEPPTSEVPVPVNPLFVDPAESDFTDNPELLERILATPHGYFRFINRTFSQEVCTRFAPLLAGRPSFNLHGDAHIEQYAITDLGRGLTDYDDSSAGPAALDLTRIGVSLSLTALRNGWEDQTGALLDELLRGYREALRDPQIEVPEPVVAQRMRAKFTYDRDAYFEWVDSIIDEVPEDERVGLAAAMEPYVEVTLAQDPTLDPVFFDPVEVGYLRMGIGSALDLKYLVRTRGPSDSPEDDVVLEVKQVRDLSEIDCISVARGDDPFRILVGQARIANQPYKYLGYARFRGYTFWVHAWVQNYREVASGESFESPEELAAVVYDIGIQLGRGHTNQIAAPLDEQLRREQMVILDRREVMLRQTIGELTDLTLEAWESFGEQVRGAREVS